MGLALSSMPEQLFRRCKSSPSLLFQSSDRDGSFSICTASPRAEIQLHLPTLPLSDCAFDMVYVYEYLAHGKVFKFHTAKPLPEHYTLSG